MGNPSLLPRTQIWDNKYFTETAEPGRACWVRAGEQIPPSIFPSSHRGRRARTYGRVAGGCAARRKSRRCSARAPRGAGEVDPSADGCQPRHAEVHVDTAESGVAGVVEDWGGVA